MYPCAESRARSKDMSCQIRANPPACNTDCNQRGETRAPSFRRISAHKRRAFANRKTPTTQSGDGDLFAEVNVLNRIEELYAVFHRALERLAARDKPRASRALIDHSRQCGVGKIVFAARTARIDEPCATQVAIGNLVAAEVDGMVARQLGVDALVELAVAGAARVERLVATVILGELLLDDVRLNRARRGDWPDR